MDVGQWFLGTLGFAALTAVWTWFICRFRQEPNDKLLTKIAESYEAMRKANDTASATTASAAAVLSRVVERCMSQQDHFLKQQDQANEMLMTLHPNAAAERMHNLLVHQLSMPTAPSPVVLNVPRGTSVAPGETPEARPRMYVPPEEEEPVERMGDIAVK